VRDPACQCDTAIPDARLDGKSLKSSRHGSFAPSIGSERKTYFPHRRRFFDPGVCSRPGWAVSS
jgi:hypothetical protein